MPSFTDSLDRLNKSANYMRGTLSDASKLSGNSRWFTRAALDTPANLPQLIRDIDNSELGLFTLVTPDSPAGTGVTHAEITRIEHHTATPLRKARTMVQAKEPDPEVYAKTALRYLDR
jgi:hypothetical protein